MKRVFVIKDVETGRYYSNDWRNYWQRDISEAEVFEGIGDIDFMLGNAAQEDNFDNPFEKVKMLEIVYLYIKIQK